MATATGKPKIPLTMSIKKSVLGTKVVNAEGEDLGKIEDVVIDPFEDRIGYAILSFGGFLAMGDKHFAIPWEALGFDLSNKVAVLNIDRDRLKNAPGFDKNNWPDMADINWANEIRTHYGYPPISMAP